MWCCVDYFWTNIVLMQYTFFSWLGLYGHSAVLDADTHLIYIHGGMAFKQSQFDISPDTYFYNMDKKQAYYVQVRGTQKV